MNIPYGRQFIDEDDINAVVETLRSPFLTQGPAISRFEGAFADYTCAKHAIACSSGTSALHLAMIALGVAPGQKVIVAPNSFVASANCVRYCGADVTFVDIDPETFLIDINKVESLLESSHPGEYSGIIVVNFAGYPVNGEKLKQISQKYNLWAVEDACHSPGAKFQNQDGHWETCGNGKYFDFSIFSFHPVKHIAAGEGGAITTNDTELFEKINLYRSHGITKDESRLIYKSHGPWYHEMQELGFNYRITDLQAGLANSQLKKAENGINRRNEIARKYRELLKDESNIRLPIVGKEVYHAYHLFVIRTKKRAELYNYLKINSIFAQVHYLPIYKHPYYQDYLGKDLLLDNCENYYKECLSIPMFPTLKDEEIEYVVNTIKTFFS